MPCCRSTNDVLTVRLTATHPGRLQAAFGPEDQPVETSALYWLSRTFGDRWSGAVPPMSWLGRGLRRLWRRRCPPEGLGRKAK